MKAEPNDVVQFGQAFFAFSFNYVTELCFMLLGLVAADRTANERKFHPLLALFSSVFQKSINITNPLFCLPSGTTWKKQWRN